MKNYLYSNTEKQEKLEIKALKVSTVVYSTVSQYRYDLVMSINEALSSSLIDKNCQKFKSEWSACDQDCGWGWSERATVGKNCKFKIDRRMCQIRPCQFNLEC